MAYLDSFRIVWRVFLCRQYGQYSILFFPIKKCISIAVRKVATLQKNRAVQRRSFCWLTAKQREKSISLQETDRKAKNLPKTCFTIFFMES